MMLLYTKFGVERKCLLVAIESIYIFSFPYLISIAGPHQPSLVATTDLLYQLKDACMYVCMYVCISLPSYFRSFAQVKQDRHFDGHLCLSL